MSTCFDIGALRSRYAETLNRTCTVPTATRAVTQVGNGTFTDDYSNPPITGVRCSFRTTSGRDTAILGSPTLVGDYVLRFEYGVALRAGMIILVNADAVDGPARRFQLIAPLDHARMLGQQWTANSYDD